MEKYPFKDKKCVCGFGLAGEKSVITGEKNDQQMGACPQCARSLPLEVEESVEPNPAPGPDEPGAGPEE